MCSSANWHLVPPGSALPFGSFVSVERELGCPGAPEINEKRKAYLLNS